MDLKLWILSIIHQALIICILLENPRMILVLPPLSEIKYHSWSKSMHHTFLSKNKLKFVNISIKILERDDPTYETW